MASSLKERTRVCIRRGYWIRARAGILRALPLQQADRVDAEALHPGADFGPFLVKEAASLGFAQPGAGARGDEHADSTLDDDQALVLEALIGFGDGQRVRLAFGGEGAD